MKRISQLFSKQKAYVAYLTVGDGGLEKTYESAKALIAGGVNLLELGVPFSDPVADGSTIQMASERALKNHVTLLDVLQVAKRLRQETNIPIILFTYFNPLFNYFEDSIFERIKTAGIDGILVVDLPIEESMVYQKKCLSASLAPIYVITQVTSDARIQSISKKGKGFLYYACRLGTTGIKEDIPSNLTLQMQRIKRLTNLPVVVGFGISTPIQSLAICEVADGFVVGSFFVNAVANGILPLELTKLANQLHTLEARHVTHP
jgi:tryptophan synthase alpha chain